VLLVELEKTREFRIVLLDFFPATIIGNRRFINRKKTLILITNNTGVIVIIDRELQHGKSKMEMTNKTDKHIYIFFKISNLTGKQNVSSSIV